MTEIEALQIAIDALLSAAERNEIVARDWRKYGDALQFGRAESRRAAETADSMREAAAVLQSLKTRLQTKTSESGEPEEE